MKREFVKAGVEILCSFGGGLIGGAIYATVLPLTNPASKFFLKKSSLFLASSGLGIKMGKTASEEWKETLDAAFDITESIEKVVEKYGRAQNAGEEQTYNGTNEES